MKSVEKFLVPIGILIFSKFFTGARNCSWCKKEEVMETKKTIQVWWVSDCLYGDLKGCYKAKILGTRITSVGSTYGKALESLLSKAINFSLSGQASDYYIADLT